LYYKPYFKDWLKPFHDMAPPARVMINTYVDFLVSACIAKEDRILISLIT